MSRPVSLVPLTEFDDKPTIGVEIEAEDGAWDQVIKKVPKEVGYCTDGSLNNGLEFQTPPANGTPFREIVGDTCAVLREFGAKVSTRCGLHVHVGFPAQKKFLRRFLLTGMAFEDVFYASQPVRRFDGTFCRPLAGHWSRAIPKLLGLGDDYVDAFYYSTGDQERLARMKGQHYAEQRYFGFNLHPCFQGRKTVEFRFAEGSVDPTEIVPYAEFCSSFVEYVLSSAWKKDDVLSAAELIDPRQKLNALMSTGFFQGASVSYMADRIRRHGKAYVRRKAVAEQSALMREQTTYGRFGAWYEELSRVEYPLRAGRLFALVEGSNLPTTYTEYMQLVRFADALLPRAEVDVLQARYLSSLMRQNEYQSIGMRTSVQVEALRSYMGSTATGSLTISNGTNY